MNTQNEIKTYPSPSGDCGLINKRDNNGLFPSNKYKILVWESDDDTVFHVDGYGWDVVFNFNSGELCGVVSAGNNVKIFEYIKNNIVSWMNLTSNICRKITNVELIGLTWNSLN